MTGKVWFSWLANVIMTISWPRPSMTFDWAEYQPRCGQCAIKDCDHLRSHEYCLPLRISLCAVFKTYSTFKWISESLNILRSCSGWSDSSLHKQNKIQVCALVCRIIADKAFLQVTFLEQCGKFGMKHYRVKEKINHLLPLKFNDFLIVLTW